MNRLPADPQHVSDLLQRMVRIPGIVDRLDELGVGGAPVRVTVVAGGADLLQGGSHSHP